MLLLASQMFSGEEAEEKGQVQVSLLHLVETALFMYAGLAKAKKTHAKANAVKRWQIRVVPRSH
jgi:hypothetical protein